MSEVPPYWKLATQRNQAVQDIQHQAPIVAMLQNRALTYQSLRLKVEEYVRGRASQYGIAVTSAREFAEIVTDDIVGLGGLETLIRDESIYNITIRWFDNQPAQVGLHRVGSSQKEAFDYPLSTTLDTFRESILANKAVRFSGQPVQWTYGNPHVTLYLPTHKVRIAANMLHDSRSIVASVRMNRVGQPDLDEIADQGMVTSEGMYKFLKVMLASRCNFLVVGSTGSGKTTLLRALLHSVDPSDYLYVVEDSPELDLDERSDLHEMILPVVPTKERTMGQLVRDSQRYMADRIIIGEALDDAIIDWFTVANVTGGGGMTLHAEEAESIFRRVNNMCGGKLTEKEVYERMSESVDVILFVRRRFDREPQRQIENVWTLTHQMSTEGRPVYGELWSYDQNTKTVKWTNRITEAIQDKFATAGVRILSDPSDAKFTTVTSHPLSGMLKGIIENTNPLDNLVNLANSMDGNEKSSQSKGSAEDLINSLFPGRR